MANLQFGCSLCNFSLPSMGNHLINLAAKVSSLHALSEEGRPESQGQASPLCERDLCLIFLLSTI